MPLLTAVRGPAMAPSAATVSSGSSSRQMRMGLSGSLGGALRPDRGGSLAPNAAGYVLNRSYSYGGARILAGNPHPRQSLAGSRTLLSGGGGFGGGMGGGRSGGGGGDNGGHRWREEPSDDSFNLSNLGELLSSMALAVGSAYSTMSTRFPVMTSGLLTACSLCLAECIAQLVVLRNPELDSVPVVRALVYGFFLKGPALNAFYSRLNSFITCRKGLNLLKLLALDCGVGSFLLCSLYAFSMPLLKGADVNTAADNLKREVVPLWCLGLKFWPAAMTVNYLFLPASLQVPYILGVDVLCNIAMCLKTSNAVQKSVDDLVLDVPAAPAPSEASPSPVTTMEEAIQILEEMQPSTICV
mmetsp:Transcript_33157/g.93889  ORF Transcript_33157/g.93889 Transcript_33157/m.93889 type:complete len:356 (+) Transcript_33157:446-1513(+)|eukprot:CAMPEP_0117661310 /NCGR_PEP_ID=MMETSP0804-20121206/7470_1 /TAXON_ID=1074897 /ORGANISM="Tetraselmis astigmatica, Strain CCMP880" /LENGTH=355 /DNA_ID=CAMNT_0005468171 /DNA_START=540 /DNA_END=1607 /DNA_ORIENTATION=+